MNNSDAYKYAFRDVIYDLVERAKGMSSATEVDQRIAMLNTLGLIKSQAITFGLDLEYLGLADFDPERWFLETSKP
ncbi:MAG TPA: hypothetical protein VGF97_15810 [Rhizomicrobium sp.]